MMRLAAGAVLALLLALPASAGDLGRINFGELRAKDAFITCFGRDQAVELAVALNRHLRAGGTINDLSGSKGGETAAELMIEKRCFRAQEIDHTPRKTVYRDEEQPKHKPRLYSVVASEVMHKSKAVKIHVVTTKDVPPPPKRKKPKFK
jgi:hypothetical protein